MKEKVLGIVAEYNPFHNGHLYHIGKALEITGASDVVVSLSSNFVQRGEPSLVDKWERAKMALLQGANLILELPSAFSCHNAGVFCSAGVDLLASTGLVTHISFGMEETSFHSLKSVIDILIEEPPSFKKKLRQYLNCGNSFVEARSLAMEDMIPGSGELLSQSNNILAIGYMMRIAQKGYALTPLPVKRIGRRYLDEALSDLASATAIRKAVKSKGLDGIIAQVPESTFSILKSAFERGRCAVEDDLLFRMIVSSCLRSSKDEISHTAEIREGIENRIIEAAKRSSNLEELVEKVATKRYPKARVQRHLIHILLSYDHWTNVAVQRLSVPYIRVLGFDDRGRRLLKKMKDRAKLPIIDKPRHIPSAYGETITNFEYRATEIWEMLCTFPQRRREIVQKPVII
jgi:predicted nucleotidyltransferase